MQSAELDLLLICHFGMDSSSHESRHKGPHGSPTGLEAEVSSKEKGKPCLGASGKHADKDLLNESKLSHLRVCYRKTQPP